MEPIEPSFPQYIGRCVYCGRADVRLTDEHVVPYAWNGTWVLQKATCDEHQLLTSRIENEVLKNAWGAARATLGVRTRHRKDRHGSYPVKLERSGAILTPQVEVRDHPGPLVMPEFAAPGKTPASSPIAGMPVTEFPMLYRPAKLRAVGVTHSADAAWVRFPDPKVFALFLAKIAHTFAVGCYGIDMNLGTPLLQALLVEDASIFRYVGNDSSLGIHTDPAGDHSVVIAGTLEERFAFVRLFPGTEAPEYVVRLDSPAAG